MVKNGLLVAVCAGLAFAPLLAVAAPDHLITTQVHVAEPYRITLKLVNDPLEAQSAAPLPGGSQPGIVGAQPSAAPLAHGEQALLVQITDMRTGAEATNALVQISFQRTTSDGSPDGEPTAVPVVRTEPPAQIGGNVAFGNNISLGSGDYKVVVRVNEARPTTFAVAVPTAI